MEVQVPVRQRIPPGHRRKNVVDWTHERPSAHEYDDNWVHADILQVCIYNMIR